MGIKKRVELVGKKFVGFVDLGIPTTEQDPSNEAHIASQNLAFMTVSLGSSWKVPSAYFLVNGLTAEVRKNIIIESIIQHYDNNVLISALTKDGTKSNIATFQLLGKYYIFNALFYT